ncbi:MAG: M28 family peptidase [Fimbriimonadaceae bacterium]|nr:M28 family peptidase [Fimbriimonadaceae bacterium]
MSACAFTATDPSQSQTGSPTQSAPKAESYAFDQAKAWAHLMKQVEFGPRVPGTDEHVKCRDYIVEEMKKHTENVRLQEFVHVWSATRARKQMWNIIGEQGWKDAKVRIVVLAHWDTRPTADMEWDSDKQKQPIAGANDGASGVAVLLELMRVMKDKRPADLGIMYLMTDGEDLGPSLEEMFLGAVHFSKNLPSPKPDYGILLDMIGDKDLQVPMEPNSMRLAGPLVNAFYSHAQKIGMSSTFPKKIGPEIYDDHLALNEKGVPTIDLIDFSYDPWHTLADTPDKCSAESLGKVGKMMESWLSQKPVWAYPKQ